MAELRFTNTLTGQKEVFEPRDPDRITLYVCGPTVYNLAHIGNARPVVTFDMLYRVLRALYPTVVYARNITDIDDKIIAAARERNEGIDAVTEEFTDKYREDMAQLNALSPDLEPRATENIEPMRDLITQLIARGHAYAAEGHVLFDVTSMPSYGALSGRNLEDMLAGARVEVADYKRSPGDFVLWKPSAEDEPGWDSPWGRGRPGWHLECSAMIEKHLGETIDIHGGGQDLIFPHHENEIAQSCCAHDGKPFANYWLHNGFINIEGEKMSKSLGNFRMVNDLLDQYPGEVLRYVLLSAHYRSEQQFSKDLLDSAWRSLDTLYGFLRGQTLCTALINQDSAGFKALLDDLNSPMAISELYRLAKQMHAASGEDKDALHAELMGLAGLMGLLDQDPEHWFTLARGGDDISAENIELLIAKRKQAKLDKDYAGADQVRQDLLDLGVVLEDSREGTVWRRV